MLMVNILLNTSVLLVNSPQNIIVAYALMSDNNCHKIQSKIIMIKVDWLNEVDNLIKL